MGTTPPPCLRLSLLIIVLFVVGVGRQMYETDTHEQSNPDGSREFHLRHHYSDGQIELIDVSAA